MALGFCQTKPGLQIPTTTTSNHLVQGYTGPNSTIPVLSIDKQVSVFLKDPPSNITTDNLLFVLYGGANDILFNPNITALQSFQEIIASKSKLSSRFPNATYLFLDYPDLSRIPYAFYITWLGKQGLRSFSQGLSALYRQTVMQNTLEVSSPVVYVDLQELFDRWDYYAEPRSYGFDPLGAYGSCLVGVYQETDNVTLCPVPDERVFWDEYHPTSHAHSFVALKVLDALRVHDMRTKR
ncbi:gdsl-like lipase acylhydrolase [Diplodia corticola]|uniref:Gdsl-like lipase acylhydrolase n=1 Tax=Diplodia corticola TaxID=236234 RepID=A0A1J9R4Q7_9PEZI|nr:gdsl-like lipase acylhydrolase [Diplodia corticola]OJD36454.1 gdsl-like lipase acylhydrolase [Diplodia corticola]